MRDSESKETNSDDSPLPWEEETFAPWQSNLPFNLMQKSRHAGNKKGFWAWWQHIPSLLNVWEYHKQLSQESETLNYEPIHLHISMKSAPASVAGRAPEQNDPGLTQVLGQTLTPEHFRFLLEQVPAIRTLVFSGPPDPFRNQHLMELVNLAYKFNQTETTIYTSGHRLQSWAESILQSPLACLVVQLSAHKPSEYWRLTGRDPSEFVRTQQQLKGFLERKKAANSSLVVDICLTVDIHNYKTMPEMLAYALELGMDGVRFENFQPEHGSDRSLYRQQAPVVRFLKRMHAEKLMVSPLHVTLPTLLDKDMSKHRHCREAYTTVSVDVDFNLYPCSHHLKSPVESGKAWDPDFWNNDMYQWLRNIHGPIGNNTQPVTQLPVPELCQHCPMNMPRTKKITPPKA